MKSTLNKENIVPDLPGIILCSHGPMAIGTLESASLIIGESENIVALALEEGDYADDFGLLIKDALDSLPKGSVIIVDLFGGSPCNQTIKMMMHKDCEINVISGLNLPMVLEASCLRYECSGKELALRLKEIGKEGIVDVNQRVNETV